MIFGYFIAIFVKETVEKSQKNRQKSSDFAIFKTPQFFEFERNLNRQNAEQSPKDKNLKKTTLYG